VYIVEVRLIPECLVNAAAHVWVNTLETFTFTVKFGDVDAAFFEDFGHTLED
jgi:hypothetical protein